MLGHVHLRPTVILTVGRPRVYVQNLPVCTGTTRTCVSTCVRVVPVHTGTF